MARSKRQRVLSVATLFVLALAGSGRLAAGEESRGDLGWTVGTWQGSRQDGADDTRAPITLRVELILGGGGFAEDVEVVHDGGVYRGFAVTVYDPEAKLWVRQYVNATRGRFARLEGEVDGNRSTWRSTTPGRTRESRLVSERLEGAGWRRTLLVSEDGGATWRTLWQDELERVSAP